MRTKQISAQRSTRKPVSAHRDPWYGRPYNAALTTEQFFDSRGGMIRVCPETALMYAVLEDAFLDFQKKFETEPQFIERAREAERWFFSDDSCWLFSFVAVCDALGLEPEYIRKKLRHWIPSRLLTAKATG